MSIKVKYEDGVFKPLEDVKGIESGSVLKINGSSGIFLNLSFPNSFDFRD